MEELTEKPRYVFLEGTNIFNLVSASHKEFEPFFVSDYHNAYEMLKNGEADAFFAEGCAEAAFDQYSDIDTNYLFPLAFTAVALSTKNPELAPLISVVQKALDDGAIRHLVSLYNQGREDYIRHKFLSSLNSVEREYIRANPIAHIAAEVTNYPVSFYNSREGDFQGIAIDVIGEIEKLTNIKFEIINGEKEEWSGLLEALETGRVAMITELIYSEERAKVFIWPENKLFSDHFALVSKS